MELCDITTNNLWTSVAMTEDGDCLLQEILHLREGHKYSFRVAAANRIGQSEPTEGEDIITKDPWGKSASQPAWLSQNIYMICCCRCSRAVRETQYS